MFVQMMEYRQPVARRTRSGSSSAAVTAWSASRSTAARPPVGRPAHQVGDLGDVLVLLHGAVRSTAACHAAAGSSLIACSSASVMAQPQVNSTMRRGEDSDSRWAISSWLAPAPSTRTSSRERMREGIWRIAAARTLR